VGTALAAPQPNHVQGGNGHDLFPSLYSGAAVAGAAAVNPHVNLNIPALVAHPGVVAHHGLIAHHGLGYAPLAVAPAAYAGHVIGGVPALPHLGLGLGYQGFGYHGLGLGYHGLGLGYHGLPVVAAPAAAEESKE